MSVPNKTTLEAAKEMLNSDREALSEYILFEGAYYTVVEGGYHSQALTDEEADFLAMKLSNGGIEGLNAYVMTEENDKNRSIAYITPIASTTGAAFEEVIARLDDGNNYPGFALDYSSDPPMFMLLEME